MIMNVIITHLQRASYLTLQITLSTSHTHMQWPVRGRFRVKQGSFFLKKDSLKLYTQQATQNLDPSLITSNKRRSHSPPPFHSSTFSLLNTTLITPLVFSPYDFPGGSDGKASVYNAGDLGSIPGLGRSPGEGNGNPLQDYCLENPMNRRAWQATVHGVAKSRTQLSDFTSLHFMKL